MFVLGQFGGTVIFSVSHEAGFTVTVSSSGTKIAYGFVSYSPSS